MASTHDEFFAWLRTAIDRGQQLLQSVLERSPVDHFNASTVKDLYAAIDEWVAWRVGVVTRLRRQVADPDALIAYLEERFASERFLVFYMRIAMDSSRVVPIDLTHRDRFLDTSGFIEMRQIINYARAEPDWRVVRQNVANDLRGFEKLVNGLLTQLVFVGEPRAASLSTAIARLATVPYLDVAAIKATAVAAESHLLAGQFKSCAAMLRPAVEQVIKDSYKEALRRQLAPQVAAIPDLRAQSEALGRGATPFLEKAIATFAYGAFALLSSLGSHAGPLDDASGEQAWHAAVAALTMLGERLPR